MTYSKSMRTTIDIPDDVYRRLKSHAAKEGTSVRVVILRGVKQVLGLKQSAAPQRVSLPLVPSKHPGTLKIDNAQIYDIIGFP